MNFMLKFQFFTIFDPKMTRKWRVFIDFYQKARFFFEFRTIFIKSQQDKKDKSRAPIGKWPDLAWQRFSIEDFRPVLSFAEGMKIEDWRSSAKGRDLFLTLNIERWTSNVEYGIGLTADGF